MKKVLRESLSALITIIMVFSLILAIPAQATSPLSEELGLDFLSEDDTASSFIDDQIETEFRVIYDPKFLTDEEIDAVMERIANGESLAFGTVVNPLLRWSGDDWAETNPNKTHQWIITRAFTILNSERPLAYSMFTSHERSLITKFSDWPDWKDSGETGPAIPFYENSNSWHFFCYNHKTNLTGGVLDAPRPTAVDRFEYWYGSAVNKYRNGDKEGGCEDLGKAIHYLSDLGTPVHTGYCYRDLDDLYIASSYPDLGVITLQVHGPYESDANAQRANYAVVDGGRYDWATSRNLTQIAEEIAETSSFYFGRVFNAKSVPFYDLLYPSHYREALEDPLKNNQRNIAGLLYKFSYDVHSVSPDTSWASRADTKWYNGNQHGSFIIRTAEELAGLAQLTNEGKFNSTILTISLGNDIDLAGFEWVPIGGGGDQYAFPGRFDGQGYVIRNLTMNGMRITSNSDGWFFGLFGIIGNAEIKNLGLENVNINIEGNHIDVGGIASNSFNSTISNVYVTGSITARGSFVRAGGIVAMNDWYSVIENSFNRASVSATHTTDPQWAVAGGIAGITASQGTIHNVYNTGTISAGADRNGGISGVLDPGGSITNSFWLGGSATRGIGFVQQGTDPTESLTATQMTQQSSFNGFNFDTVWGFRSGMNNNYPILKVFLGTPITTVNLNVSAPRTSNTPSTFSWGANGFDVDSVVWTPNNVQFQGDTIYTVTMTLFPHKGRTFYDIPESNVQINGQIADIIENTNNKLIISRTFPKTTSAPQKELVLYMLQPWIGDTPADSVTGGILEEGWIDASHTVDSITWLPNHGTFQENTNYTVTITLTSWHSFVGVTSAIIMGDPATIVNNTGESITVALTYELGSAISIDTSDLPKTGTVGVLYNWNISYYSSFESYGTLVHGDFQASHDGGTLPPGLQFSNSPITGPRIIGTPTQSGSWTFSIRVSAPRFGYTAVEDITITIEEPPPFYKFYTVTFVNWDGTVLEQQLLEYGTTPVYGGSVPTKAATAQYTYSFSGWEPTLALVTGPASYMATYSSDVNEYTNSITGAVSSFNPRLGARIELQTLDGVVISYATTETSEAGSAVAVMQNFSIDNVQPGTYKLVVTKPGHLGFTLNNVIVTDSDVDLTTHLREDIRVFVLRPGDLNNDTFINSQDTTLLLQNFGVATPDNMHMDLNGDGFINTADRVIIQQNFGHRPIEADMLD